jgi:hypothetical protein
MENIKKINFDVSDMLVIHSHDSNNVKHINVDLTPKKERSQEPEEEEEIVEPKIPRKRVITENTDWTFTEVDLTAINQFSYVTQIYTNKINPGNELKCKIVLQQLKYKLSGYRNQDVVKKMYLKEKFITIERTLQLLFECNCRCFYCKSDTKVLYEHVREPTQWSLERIDNSIGHNMDNVTIACLNCNLRRRTMDQERYIFTKQLVLVKKE